MRVNRLPHFWMSLSLCVLFLLTAVAQVAAQDIFGDVTCDNIDLRTGAGAKYASYRVALLGEPLKLIGRNADNSWLRVSIFSNRRGAWLPANCITTATDINLLQVAVPTGINSGFVSTSALNLRKGPGANFDVIITLNVRSIFDAIGKNADDSWVKVRLPGNIEGWFSTRYVVLNNGIENVPVVDVTGISDGLPNPVPVGNTVVGFFNQEARLYFGPGTQYGHFVTLPSGTGVYLRGRNTPNTWLLVQQDNGDIGWMSKSWLNTDYDTLQLMIVGNS